MKHIINICIFLTIAVVVWWSITSKYSDSNSLQQATNTDYAEIFMNEFKMTSMAKDGRPSYILQGSHLRRANDSADAVIRQPVFQFFQKNNRWHISAKNAIINDKEETIQLKNDVIMQQKDIEPAITIRTQYLLIHTDTQVASTQVPIDIKHGKSHFTSNGMLFNNKTSVLDLSSQVKGRYSSHD